MAASSAATQRTRAIEHLQAGGLVRLRELVAQTISQLYDLTLQRPSSIWLAIDRDGWKRLRDFVLTPLVRADAGSYAWPPGGPWDHVTASSTEDDNAATGSACS